MESGPAATFSYNNEDNNKNLSEIYACKGDHDDQTVTPATHGPTGVELSEDSRQQVLLTEGNNMSSLTSANKAMKSLKDLVPCEFSREAITQSADELINSLNAKRKRDSEILEDFKKTAEIQTKRTCTVLEQQMFKIYEKQGKDIQDKIQELYAILDRIAKLEAKIEEFKRALQGLCHEFN